MAQKLETVGLTSEQLGGIVAVPAAALLKLQLDRYLDKKEATLSAQAPEQ